MSSQPSDPRSLALAAMVRRIGRYSHKRSRSRARSRDSGSRQRVRMKERSRSRGLRSVLSDTCTQVRPPARADPLCLALSPECIHPIRALHTITGRCLTKKSFISSLRCRFSGLFLPASIAEVTAVCLVNTVSR